MSLKLNGSLTYFPLINVFDFLISTGACGLISVENEEKKGEAYLDNGEILYASYRNLFSGKEAFFKLFTVSEGNFYFKHIDNVPERTLTQNTRDLMGELAEKLVSWEELKKIVSSEQMYFKVIPASMEFKADEILLSRDQWLILTRLDGCKNIDDIIRELDIEFIEVSEIIAEFFRAGFVQPVDMFETKEIQKTEKPLDCAILSGDLKNFSLLAIIEFLSHLRLSGKLKLSRGMYQGEIFMDKGELIHADNNIWDGEMALVDLLSWSKGKFSFMPILSSFKQTMMTPVEEILLTVGENLNKWRKMQSIITDPELIFIANLTGQEKDDDEKLTFSRRHWKVMYNIDGKTTIRRIADKMKLHNVEVADIVYTLYKEGLIEPLHPQHEIYEFTQDTTASKEITHIETINISPEQNTVSNKIEKKKDKKKSKKFKEEEKITEQREYIEFHKPVTSLKGVIDDLIAVMDTKKDNPDEVIENFLDR